VKTISTRLAAARIWKDLTQTQLAELSGLSQGLVSKLESGHLPLDARRASVLGPLLNVEPDLLVGPAPAVEIRHLAKSALSERVRNKLAAALTINTANALRTVGDTLPDLPTAATVTPDSAPDGPESARRLRTAWKVPAGPIPHLVNLLERHGVSFYPNDMTYAQLDALASSPIGHRMIMQINRRSNREDVRVAVAHELGHAVMHSTPSVSAEREANRFAAELLFPSEQTGRLLFNLSIASLDDIEGEWGVPASVILNRARDDGRLTSRGLRHLRAGLEAASLAAERSSRPVELPSP